MEPVRFLRLKEVAQLTGLSRASIHQKIADGKFPRQVNLSGKAVAWVESEVLGWQRDRIAARDGGAS